MKLLRAASLALIPVVAPAQSPALRPVPISAPAEVTAQALLAQPGCLWQYFHTLIRQSGSVAVNPAATSLPADPNGIVPAPPFSCAAFTLGPDLLFAAPGGPDFLLPRGVWQPFAATSQRGELPALVGTYLQLRIRPGAIVPLEAGPTEAAASEAKPLHLWISLDESGHAEGQVYEDGSTSYGQLAREFLLTTYRASYQAGQVVLSIAQTEGAMERRHRRVIAELGTDSGIVRAEGDDGAAIALKAAGSPGAYADGRPAARYRLEAHDTGQVLNPGGGPDNCDVRGAREAVVYREDGTYYLFYDGSGPRGWLACQATSSDLRHWKTRGPILEFGAPGSPDSATATSPWSIREDGPGGKGLWHMFYVGSQFATPPPDFIPMVPYVTLTATAEQLGGPWRKDYAHVPFGCVPGSWRSVTASPGYLVRDHGEYLQFFSATKLPRPNLYKRTLGLARAKNLNGPWQVDPEPLFSNEEQVENSSVYYEKSNGWWFLFTNHLGGEPLADGGIGEYTDAIWMYWSKDPRHWREENKAVVLDGANCTWSGRCIGMPAVIPAEGRLALLYDAPGGWGRSNMFRSIGLAWLPLPLSPPRSANQQ